MADLEANFMHLQLMHESVARFSESFASFLYGMNMNAFCVDFPEVRITLAIYTLKPITDSVDPYSRILSKSQTGRSADRYALTKLLESLPEII